ncbi:hypothetical protein GUITHDRAFT_110327 [Guillardia theta CCMP2712]|uniref:Uncharacterized protein n=1 Tax=Guillardia theta (strain CCMP2712) TaxID=905079 RepID=L1J5S0_GUITC|nr:hypothetical protein GUITHDRAFT_110327 [Guillardia theta CCMP2712]EKX43878.1 hypothetical protein GUITHDRAFT_110327 [Guillardia theta CCMP2712]|eukprot:XP_005830858.1 hypothetical protein GUITHDRAFT_110327 [Guillardia theta CCMP2712]
MHKVEAALSRFLGQLPLQGEEERRVSDAISELLVVAFEEKRSRRDADKEHQGYALLKVRHSSLVQRVIDSVEGQEMGEGARARLRASRAKKRSEFDTEEEERRRREEEEKKTRLEVIDRLAPPPLSTDAWRELSCPEQLVIDWESIPSSCRPDFTLKEEEDGRKRRRERKMETAESRATRKRKQVESFLLLLREILAGWEGDAPVIVDFGCGSGNLLLPLASVLP